MSVCVSFQVCVCVKEWVESLKKFISDPGHICYLSYSRAKKYLITNINLISKQWKICFPRYSRENGYFTINLDNVSDSKHICILLSMLLQDWGIINYRYKFISDSGHICFLRDKGWET